MTTKTQITKEECAEVIDYFADKTLSRNCEIDTGGFDTKTMLDEHFYLERNIVGEGYEKPRKIFSGQKFEILGHPILLGNVFAKLWNEPSSGSLNDFRDTLFEISKRWIKLENKPLQQILEEVEWDKYCIGCDIHYVDKIDGYCDCGDMNEKTATLKSPAKDLFIFLHNLISKK